MNTSKKGQNDGVLLVHDRSGLLCIREKMQ